MKTIIVTNAQTKEENGILVHQILSFDPSDKFGKSTRIMLHGGTAIFIVEDQTELLKRIKAA